MHHDGEAILVERSQWIVLAGLLFLIGALSLILFVLDRRFLRPLVGDVNPWPVMTVVLLIGGFVLWWFMKRGWFYLLGEDLAKGFGWAMMLALLFGVIIVLVDRQAVYPADTNVSWPNAWLYYPVMGFTAQVICQLLPLAIVLMVLTSSRIGMSFDRAVLPGLLLAAVLEPVFQTLFGLSNPIPAWAKAYVAVHILLINLSQLIIFHRNGFIPSYALRLAYYLIWHILWGRYRLDVLF